MPIQTKSQTGLPKETDETKNKEEKGRVATFLNEIANETNKFSDERKDMYEILEKYYYGIQWNNEVKSVMDKSHQVKYTGELAWYFEDEVIDQFNTDQKLPQRVVNEIFPFVETQTSLLRKANITLSAMPPNMYADEKSKQKETSRIFSLIFQTVFGKEFQSEMEKGYREIAIHDHAFMYLDYDTNKEKKKEIPFFIRYEKAKSICGDKEADTWSQSCWSVRRYKLRKFWIVRKYPDSKEMDTIKSKKDMDIIELQEIIVRQDLVYPDTGNPDRWVKFVRYGNTILQEAILPIMPIECFRTYQTDGWWGISEVKLMKPHQDAENRIQSQADWNRALLALPPAMVTDSVTTKEGEMFLYPGMTIPMQYSGAPPVQIVPIVQMNPDSAISAIKNEENFAENITGIQKIMQGQNVKGVYSGAHAKILQDSGMMRLEGKLQPVKDNLILLGKKLLKGIEEIVSIGINIQVYDPLNNKMIDLTKEMFVDYDRYDIITETTDANMLSPIERIEYLKELMKYGSIDNKNFLIPLDNIMPGLLNKDIMKTMKDQLLMQNDLEMKKLVVAGKELEFNMAKMDVEMQKLTAPPPPAEPTAPPVNQMETPQEVPPAIGQEGGIQPVAPQPTTAPDDGEAVMQQFIEQQLQLMLNNGIVQTPEEGEEFIRKEFEIAKRNNPNATPQQLVAMVQEEILNGGQ